MTAPYSYAIVSIMADTDHKIVNRGGRPKKPFNKRFQKKTLMVSPDDYRLLSHAAEIEGTNVSEFIRGSALRRAREVLKRYSDEQS